MPTQARTGPAQSQGLEFTLGIPRGWQGLKSLSHLLLLVPGAQLREAGSAVEEPGLEPAVLIWKAGIPSCGLTVAPNTRNDGI